MSNPVAQASKPALRTWTRARRQAAPVISWVKSITQSPRRAALSASAVILLVIAIITPLSRGDVIDSVQFSVAFLATLLTGEAVIFALSFSPSSAWPSLREIDAHIAFREWVVAGWLAAMLTAGGLLLHTAIPGTYGALLFLLANVFGMFSFIRLFGLASADGRQRLLRRTLTHAIDRVATPEPGLQHRMRENPVLNAYRGQFDEAAARSDGNGVRELADELATTPTTMNGTAALALHLEVVHRLAKAALVGKLDPVIASGAAEVLVGSFLTRAATPCTDAEVPDAHRAAGAMAQASRYLAWLASTSLTLSVQDVTTAGAARELVAFSVRARDQILRLADPDPPYAAGATDMGTPLTDTTSVLAWIGSFTEFHGSHHAAGLYPVYEILAGSKFLGNYWDGDSVLTGLRDALFAPDAADGPAAQAARRSFENAGEFDRIWTLISADAIATLRDVRREHPPELVRPEFSPDPQLLGAYLRTFASHRYFTTSEEAMRALTRTIGHAGHPGDLWHQVRAAAAPLGWSVPMPTIEPHRRPSACVLAIASRLAPLAPGEPDRQLRAFLAGLPAEMLNATARLAARTLPPAETDSASSPAGDITARLRILQLVGTHRASPP
jgi:hypothetical protein